MFQEFLKLVPDNEADSVLRLLQRAVLNLGLAHACLDRVSEVVEANPQLTYLIATIKTVTDGLEKL